MTRKRLVAVLLALAAAVGLVQYELGVWADRTVAFLAFMVLGAVLLVLADWLLATLVEPAWPIVSGMARSGWRAALADPQAVAFAGRHPRLTGWLGRRVTFERPTGWYLTATALLAGWCLYGFVSVALDLMTSSALVRYDPQVSALLRAFRTPGVTRVLWSFTVLGDARTLTLLTGLAAALLVVWGRRSAAILLAGAMASGSTLVWLLKQGAQRTRPPAEFALVRTPGSLSFPSGHAFSTLVLFGVLAFFVAGTVRGLRSRSLVVVAFAVPVVLTGLSRVYLGVHWASDVAGSWALAAGWIVVWLGAYLAYRRYGHAPPEPAALGTRRLRGWTTAASAALALAVLGWGAVTDPLLARATQPPAVRVLAAISGTDDLPTLDQSAIASMPRFSEKLDGSPQEPFGLVFLGGRGQLEAAFGRAGWTEAERPGVLSLAKAAWRAWRDEPYPSAPVTPSFLGGSVQTVAFQEPQGRATVRRRHHARFWLLPFTADGRQVWVATASFDSGLGVVGALRVPTHRIDPDIDAERDYIARDLVATGLVGRSGSVTVASPTAGTNAQGDTWFTDGRAVVLAAK